MIVWTDIETFHPRLDVTDVGAHVYAKEAEIILCGLAIDDDDPWIWEIGEDPEPFQKALQEAKRIIAFNSFFERNVFGRRNWVRRSVSDWGCTQAQAYAHGLPGSLDGLCKSMGLSEDEGKLADGKRLIRKFCVPNNGIRITKKDAPEDWALFRKYVGMDVTSMRTAYKKMPRANYDAARL